MTPLTNDEKAKLTEYIRTLSAEQILAVVMAYLPTIIASGNFNPTGLLAYLNGKSSTIQARLDVLDSVKAAEEASLTAEKTIIDGFITKLQS